MKKNSGFSLVELIVVIAIMAVLVGVLAPAYLKYVEKSRKSTDIDAISEIMNSAEKVATDVEFEALTSANSTFVLHKTGSSSFDFTLQGNVMTAGLSASSQLTSAWADSANAKSNKYTLKSKEFKALNEITFTGTILPSGAVSWAKTGDYTKMTDYSAAFAGKFSS